MKTEKEEIQKGGGTRRTIWIDAAKFFAILAVLTDHTFDILYTSPKIRLLSYCSVSVFIILTGVTSYWSFQKGNFQILKKEAAIFLPYIAATFIYSIAFNNYSFDFELFLQQLIRFNAFGHLYYVLLYMQLILIAPVFFHLFRLTSQKKYGFVLEAAVFLAVIFLSVWTSRKTNILSVYGGGGKLFGGSYLILYFLGMWLAKYDRQIKLSQAQSCLLLMVSLVSLGCYGYFYALRPNFLDQHNLFGDTLNPPGVTLCVFAVLITILFYSLGKLLDHYPNGFPTRLFRLFSIPGRHTLYIFLYHALIIVKILMPVKDFLYHSLKSFNAVRIIFYAGTILLSIGIEFVFKRIRKIIIRCYTNISPDNNIKI